MMSGFFGVPRAPSPIAAAAAAGTAAAPKPEDDPEDLHMFPIMVLAYRSAVDGEGGRGCDFEGRR